MCRVVSQKKFLSYNICISFAVSSEPQKIQILFLRFFLGGGYDMDQGDHVKFCGGVLHLYSIGP